MMKSVVPWYAYHKQSMVSSCTCIKHLVVSSWANDEQSVLPRCTNDDGIFVCKLWLVNDILYVNDPSVILCEHDKGSTYILCIMHKSVVSWCAYDEESMGVTDCITQSAGGTNWMTRTQFVWMVRQPPIHSASSSVNVLNMLSFTIHLCVLMLDTFRTSHFWILWHNLHIMNT